jgi:hypothetical protein
LRSLSSIPIVRSVLLIARCDSVREPGTSRHTWKPLDDETTPKSSHVPVPPIKLSDSKTLPAIGEFIETQESRLPHGASAPHLSQERPQAREERVQGHAQPSAAAVVLQNAFRQASIAPPPPEIKALLPVSDRPPTPVGRKVELTRKPSIPALPALPTFKPHARDPSVAPANVPAPNLPNRTSWLVKARETKAPDELKRSTTTTPAPPPRPKFAPKRKSEAVAEAGEDTVMSKVPRVSKDDDITTSALRMPGDFAMESDAEEHDQDYGFTVTRTLGFGASAFTPGISKTPAPPPLDSSQRYPINTPENDDDQTRALDLLKKTVEGLGTKQGHKPASKSLGGKAAAQALVEAKKAAAARLAQRQGTPNLPGDQEDDVEMEPTQLTEAESQPMVVDQDPSPMLGVFSLPKDLELAAKPPSSGVHKVRQERVQPVPQAEAAPLKPLSKVNNKLAVVREPSPEADSPIFTLPLEPKRSLEKGKQKERSPPRVFQPLKAHESSIFNPFTAANDDDTVSNVFHTQTTASYGSGPSIFDRLGSQDIQGTQDTAFDFSQPPTSLIKALLDNVDDDNSTGELTRKAANLPTARDVFGDKGMRESGDFVDVSLKATEPVAVEPSSDFERMDTDLETAEDEYEGSVEDDTLAPQAQKQSPTTLPQALVNHASALLSKAFGGKKEKVNPQVKSIALAQAAAKKVSFNLYCLRLLLTTFQQQEEQDKKAARLKDMELRRQAVLAKKAEEERTKAVEKERKTREEEERRRKEREVELKRSKLAVKKV